MPMSRVVNTYDDFQEPPTGPVEVELPPEDGEDDGANPEPQAFTQNLAEELTDDELTKLSSELIEYYEADNSSREEWYQAYVEGLDLLGMKKENRTQPWDGACGVYHPILTEAVVRFQSNAIVELFPASGPAKPVIFGDETPEKADLAFRVIDEINYQLTEKMVEYRGETEQLLFRLPMSGSVFRKVYFDPLKQRPCAMMVPCDDFVVDFGATDLENCERYTHVMRRSDYEVQRLQEIGFYRQIELPEAETDNTEIKEKEQALSGHHPSYEKEIRRVLLEFHCEIPLVDGEEGELGDVRPYVVTVDKATTKVLSIYRNWREGDPLYAKRQYFAHYQYMPGMGFYGLGLIHLIGGIASSATSILRQLVDAGTLSNLPGGLKTRGLRTKEENIPVAPGEWREVDVPAGTIRDNLFPLPYKEPSVVLYQLLQTIVEDGRRVGSIADIDVGAMNENSPVGTVLALLERSMKVMSAVHARIHAGLRRELGLIAAVISEYMPPQYDYDAEGKFNRQQDFDGRVDIVPVSDPNAATQTAKVVQLQAVMQMAQQAPQVYNLKALHRMGLEAIGFKGVDQVIPEDQPPPMADPITENMNVLNGQPVKAYLDQDHDAHLKVHMTSMSDPKMIGMLQNSPQAPAIQGAMESHVREHLGFAYRRDFEKAIGTTLPPPGQPMPPEVEAKLSRMVADKADQVLAEHQAEAAADHTLQAGFDPLYQLREREVTLKEGVAKHKAVMDENKLVLDQSKHADKVALDEEKLRSQERQKAAEVAANMLTFQAELTTEEAQLSRELGHEVAGDIRKDVLEAAALHSDNVHRERDRQVEIHNAAEDRKSKEKQAKMKPKPAAKAK